MLWRWPRRLRLKAQRGRGGIRSRRCYGVPIRQSWRCGLSGTRVTVVRRITSAIQISLSHFPSTTLDNRKLPLVPQTRDYSDFRIREIHPGGLASRKCTTVDLCQQSSVAYTRPKPLFLTHIFVDSVEDRTFIWGTCASSSQLDASPGSVAVVDGGESFCYFDVAYID